MERVVDYNKLVDHPKYMLGLQQVYCHKALPQPTYLFLHLIFLVILASYCLVLAAS